MFREAIAECQSAARVFGDWPALMGALGHVYALSGETAAAKKIPRQLTERSRQSYVPALAIAWIYVGLGDREQAFAWLAKAVEERGEVVSWLKTDPLLAPLRGDRRFEDLLQKMRLAP